MSDPAVEAARRAFDKIWPEQGDFEFNWESSVRDYAIGSAREALSGVEHWKALWRGTVEDSTKVIQERDEALRALDKMTESWKRLVEGGSNERRTEAHSGSGSRTRPRYS